MNYRIEKDTLGEVKVPKDIASKARLAIDRMLSIS